MDQAIKQAQRESFLEFRADSSGLRRLFQNVIRHAGIGARDSVENDIERNLSTSRIAVLAGFNQSLGFAKGCGIDEHIDLSDAIDYQDGLRVGRGDRDERGAVRQSR